jgi:hypothetical protein
MGHPIINIKIARYDNTADLKKSIKFMLWRFGEAFALANEISPDGKVTLI